ncbi:hypothetical protein NDU88_001658 [Pleurodeles waltl]|uniref:Uncharacterized protein n=1 Tax=Pleurodeles waltl TaxID=8319 RepID=A0AAV7Q7Q0_PLEWA|nr:hypothetical protein NDU88_001658 [Pleurodeles waltl]
MQPHSRRGHLEIPAGPAGGNLVSARRPSGDLARNKGAGSKWSRRCCAHATGAVAPVALFTVCSVRGPLHCPCQWHGQSRGPATPRTASLFLAVQTARKRLAVGGLVIPVAALPWRITTAGDIVAGNHRPRRCDRSASAAVVMTREAPPACWWCFRHYSPGGLVPPGL